MKKIILVAAFALFGLSMNAQNGDFKIGINGAIPTGDAGDVADFSLGLDLVYLWDVAEKFDVGVATGFTNAFTNDIEFAGTTIEVDDVQFIPIAGAARFNVSTNFYLGADLGYAIGIDDGNDGGFYYRPKVGYSFSDRFGLNVSYTGISVDGGSWDTIGVGLEFGL